MMIFFYSILTYLFIPLVPIYLLKRSIKNKKYRLFWSERFSFNIPNYGNDFVIWIHSVSVGETRAIAKLIQLLSESYPNYKIIVTVMTPTGRDTAIKLFPDVIVRYVPYDFNFAVKKFYQKVKPKIGLIVETEIWPNLTYYANYYKIPLLLINARLSYKSYKAYKRLTFFTSGIINKFNGIICQDNSTSENFLKLGYNGDIKTVGNIKFDIVYDEEKLTNLIHLKSVINDKKVIMFFSTRDGEEEIIVSNIPENIDYLIIIVPRHPERFYQIEQLLIKNKILYKKRSQNIPVELDTKVLLGDSMGEMLQYYKLCDLAIVGGSFINKGGQNLIEPLAINKPVIFGESMFNFKDVGENALKYGCAIQVKNIRDCFKEVEKLFSDSFRYQKMVASCIDFINNYTGASYRTIEIINKYLK